MEHSSFYDGRLKHKRKKPNGCLMKKRYLFLIDRKERPRYLSIDCESLCVYEKFENTKMHTMHIDNKNKVFMIFSR